MLLMVRVSVMMSISGMDIQSARWSAPSGWCSVVKIRILDLLSYSWVYLLVSSVLSMGTRYW